MAAPITHIVLADKVFGRFFLDKDKADFYVGTSFPDIRYLGVIDRDKTHKRDLSLDDVKKERSSFMSGSLFHSLVDIIRERFIKENGIYSLLPESSFLTQAIKIYEDQVLFDQVANWSEVIGFFDRVLPEEQNFGIKEEDLKKWHFLLQKYLQKKPNDEDIHLFISNIGRPREMSEEIIRLIRIMEKEPRIGNIVEDFYNRFEQLITDSSF